MSIYQLYGLVLIFTSFEGVTLLTSVMIGALPSDTPILIALLEPQGQDAYWSRLRSTRVVISINASQSVHTFSLQILSQRRIHDIGHRRIIEVFRALDPDCICGNGAVIGIGVSPGNAPVIVDPWADVSKVTPPKLVKINTNPYN